MHYLWTALSGLPVIFSYFQGLATIAIAYLAVRIASQQRITNDLRSKLDLFDRRFRIYDEVNNILGAMYTTSVGDERLLEFLMKTKETVFVFGPDIQEYREEIRKRVHALSFAREGLKRAMDTAPQERRAKLAEDERREVEWATEQSRLLPTKFKGYLNVSKL